MTELEKPATSSVNSKEKSSLLDIDIGKEFLSSWKSMSVVDDGMDFDFGSPAKGKKKAFQFDKMDMDFSLDADFDKLSSFKIDMSSLDISSPLKKSEKSKDQSDKVSSGGHHRTKKDSFAFPFDFDEFADLDFESRTKTDDKSHKSKDREGSLNISGSGGSEGHLANDVEAIEDDGMSSKHPASRSMAIFKVDTYIGKTEDPGPRNEDDHLKSGTDESHSFKPAIVEEHEIQREISPEKIISSNLQEPIQEIISSEKRSTPELYAPQVIQDLSGQPLADNVSTQGTALKLQEEEFETGARIASLNRGDEQNANAKPVAGLVPTNRSSSFENLSAPVNSPSQKAEMNKLGDDHVLTGQIDGCDISNDHPNLGSSSVIHGIHNLAQAEVVNKRDADTISKLPFDSPDSGTTIDELVPEKERRNIVHRSKYFTRKNGNESELPLATLSQTKLISIGSKRESPTHTVEERELGSKDVESGSKFTGTSGSLLKELSRAIPVHCENTEIGRGKGFGGTRERLNVDSTQIRSESMATTVVHDEGVTKVELVPKGSEWSTEHKNALRFDVRASSSNERSNKSIAQYCQNPGLQVTSIASAHNMRKIAVEKNYRSPIKAETRSSEVSTMKVSRAIEAKLKPLSSLLPKNLTSTKNKEQGADLQGTMVLKRTPCADTKKQTPMKNKEQGAELQGIMVLKRTPSIHTKEPTSRTPTLKRKTFEESAELLRLTPLKRLSASPSSNKIKGLSETVVDEQKARSAISQTPRLDVSLFEMNTSSAIEDDGNVEKAEAYSKELDNICNMLKKKHEEAKDILVRAIVNNNNLLMLNHPIYQDKIQKVQKFAVTDGQVSPNLNAIS